MQFRAMALYCCRDMSYISNGLINLQKQLVYTNAAITINKHEKHTEDVRPSEIGHTDTRKSGILRKIGITTIVGSICVNESS